MRSWWRWPRPPWYVTWKVLWRSPKGRETTLFNQPHTTESSYFGPRGDRAREEAWDEREGERKREEREAYETGEKK